MTIERRVSITAVQDHIRKIVSLHERGALTTKELVDSFVETIVRTGSVDRSRELVTLLSQEVESLLKMHLQDIAEGEYTWRPFIVGSDPFRDSEYDRDFESGLRDLCSVVGD